MKNFRICRPSSVRMGMFCRFGSALDSRPVAVPVCLKVVWIRPSLSATFRRPST